MACKDSSGLSHLYRKQFLSYHQWGKIKNLHRSNLSQRQLIKITIGIYQVDKDFTHFHGCWKNLDFFTYLRVFSTSTLFKFYLNDMSKSLARPDHSAQANAPHLKKSINYSTDTFRFIWSISTHNPPIQTHTWTPSFPFWHTRISLIYNVTEKS